MNFIQLRAIIKNIKTHVTCPKCNGNYASKDLSVLSSMGNRCLIIAKCDECDTPIMISAVVRYEGDLKEPRNIITEQRKIMDIKDIEESDMVSTDDVVQIHQLLKNYSGDFSEIFGANGANDANEERSD